MDYLNPKCPHAVSNWQVYYNGETTQDTTFKFECAVGKCPDIAVLLYFYSVCMMLRLSDHNPHRSHRVHCELGQQRGDGLRGDLHLHHGTETLLHGRNWLALSSQSGNIVWYFSVVTMELGLLWEFVIQDHHHLVLLHHRLHHHHQHRHHQHRHHLLHHHLAHRRLRHCIRISSTSIKRPP